MPWTNRSSGIVTVGTVNIRWITAFIDRPAVSFEADVAFWASVTRSTVSPRRGDRDEFATLLPPDGDPYLRVQRVELGGGTTHIDLHVDDPSALVVSAIRAGATRIDLGGPVPTLSSPGGLTFCAVNHDGELDRPRPSDTAPDSIVDQVSIDVGADDHSAEVAFWSELIESQTHHSTVRDEFTFVRRLPGQPLRLMIQRCDETAEAAAHLDWSCTDVDEAEARHVALGGSVIERFPFWTVMSDPGGTRYCLTRRRVEQSYSDPTG